MPDEYTLTDQERERLRPRIDVGALERFLAAVPQKSRRVYFLACARNVTDNELKAIGIVVPPVPQGPPPAPPVPMTLPDGRQGWRVQFLPARNTHLALRHVADPDLDRLWEQVEPLGDRGA